MRIEMHIYAGPMSIDPDTFEKQLNKLEQRMFDFIRHATITSKSGAITDQTFLDDKGMIIGTIKIHPGV
jgi:hypothetical protein